MPVIDRYKYQLHFHCSSCGHAWVEGHHIVTLEEPCPRWFCSDEPIANYTYERSPELVRVEQPAKPAAAKRAIKPAA